MEIELTLELETPVFEMDRYQDDPEVQLKHYITLVKVFAFMFDFTISSSEPFWGAINEKFTSYRETGYHFKLLIQFPMTKLSLVSSAISVFTSYHGFKITDEKMYVVDNP